MNEKSNSSKRSTKSIFLWIILFFIIGLILSSIFYFDKQNELILKKISNISKEYTDTVYIEKEVQAASNIEFARNKQIEDSLQNRINRVLDSLAQLEQKLKFMQENSNSSIDLIISIADSIDTYRTETKNLKLQIEKITLENSILLQKERKKNEELRKKIKYYEQRIMTLYAINLEVTTYSDGYDQNNRLVTTNKAKKIEEILITFQLSRDIEREEKISVEIQKGIKKIFIFNDLRPQNRIITHRLWLNSVNKFTQGKYTIVVYHTNEKHNIYNSEIGKINLRLE